MTRVFIPIGSALASALVFGIALFPLKLALSASPVEAIRTEGTVWNGQLRGAQVAGYSLGDVTIDGRPLQLLTGRFAARISASGPLGTGEAEIVLSPGRAAARAGAFSTRLDAFALEDAVGAPMTGKVTGTIDELVVAGGECVAAAIAISTDTFLHTAERLGGEGALLDGRAVCEDGALVATLNGAGPEGRADVRIRVSDRGYQTELVLQPDSAVFAERLERAGFQRQNGSYSRVLRGEVF